MVDESNRTEIDLNNAELQQALQLIKNTRCSLFLTGKAGTGKSTFLRYIASNTKKKHIVLAPTGIAAINAGGTTLHSFFKLPFYPILPTDVRYSIRNLRNTMKYNREKIKIIQEVELIIIDEISMVRADIIDFIDRILRVYSHNMREPFGGKQLLLVGDIYQLEPVLKEEEWRLLSPFYKSKFFFDANVFKSFELVSIELKKVYRQKDQDFLNILDHIRTCNVTDADLSEINKSVHHEFTPRKGQLGITLATRRDTVDYINNTNLNNLPGEVHEFTGIIDGDFPENNLPTPINLELKIGAQVLFIKNDREHRWVNGTLGIVTAIDDDDEKPIKVETENGDEVEVEQTVWSNVIYTFNEQEKKIEETEIGTYQQFPLRLAWSVTVHKSQGLTFNHVKIDLGGGAFAGGQTYVALSRCTSLQGISLSSPIHRSDIFVNPKVTQFANDFNNRAVINRALRQSKADLLYKASVEAFDKCDMQACIDTFIQAIHARYDVEQPVAKRFIRRKLSIVSTLRSTVNELKDELATQQKQLKKLSVEYTLMGHECEKEHMLQAAINNYEKALNLWADNPKAQRALKKLKGSK